MREAVFLIGLAILLMGLGLLARHYASLARCVPDRTALTPENSQRVNPRRLESGSYGLVGKPVTMGVRRADGTLKSQDAETEAEARWLSNGPDASWRGPRGR